MKLYELIQLLKSEPWQSIRSMAERLGTARRYIDRMIGELELVSRKGVCPLTGRKTLVFAIQLPKSKRKELV